MKDSTKLGRWLRIFVILTLAALVLTACSPYAGVSVGIPFKVGPAYINPSIGIGAFL